MSGKNNITVRKQKIRKNHTKAKLVFFLVLTALLLFVAAFAKYLCLMILMPRIWHLPRNRRDRSIYSGQTVMEEICFPV